jgi:hypothetical protein
LVVSFSSRKKSTPPQMVLTLFFIRYFGFFMCVS